MRENLWFSVLKRNQINPFKITTMMMITFQQFFSGRVVKKRTFHLLIWIEVYLTLTFSEKIKLKKKTLYKKRRNFKLINSRITQIFYFIGNSIFIFNLKSPTDLKKKFYLKFFPSFLFFSENYLHFLQP